MIIIYPESNRNMSQLLQLFKILPEILRAGEMLGAKRLSSLQSFCRTFEVSECSFSSDDVP